MKKLNGLKWAFLLIVSIFLISACGGGTAVTTDTKQVKAIDKIASYAENGSTPPTLQDYKDAGLIGVNEENLNALNNAVEKLTSNTTDTKEELQGILDNLKITCAQVITHAYNPNTKEEKDFPTPCDVPTGWITGTPPIEKDTIAPVITRLGNETITLNVGDNYIDAGATASDNEDGDITNNIATNNPVDTAVADTYTITYNVDDAAGNHATQITRSVKVNPIILRTYGIAGGNKVAPAITESIHGNSVIITPEGINAAHPVPVIFFAPGFKNTDYTEYKTLLNFIASHGYAVIFAKDPNGFSSDILMKHIKQMVDNPAIKPLLDTSRIGVIGHSSGGGHAFRILKEFSDTNNEGWGKNGRFLLALEPWFALDMSKNDMRSLPSNTNIIIQQYGVGGNNKENDTDARIPLTEYYLLDSIADKQKDYQVFLNANHDYPYLQGDYSEMQGILKPLDALMELTFKKIPEVGAQETALEVGSDDPYKNGHGIQNVKLINGYKYKCHGHKTIINYCEIFPGAFPPESTFNRIVTNTTIAKPELGKSIIDQEFGKTITRLTDRANQNDSPKVNSEGKKRSRGNAHPYPKTQAWNSDMSMIRMGYRLYDANTLKELTITSITNSLSELYHINWALNEKKWSSIDPNVFYGVNNGNGEKNGNFWKGTINDAKTEIKFDLVKSFASNEYTYDRFTIGKYEGNIDYNDKYVVFAARKTGNKYLTAIVYDIQNNVIKKQFDFTNIAWPDKGQVFDWMSVSPLGNHILISTGGKIDQYDMDLKFVRALASSGGHGDLGVAQDGGEVYVQYEYGGNSGIWIYRLSDGYRIRLLPDKYNGGHISCRNYNRRGWCYAGTTTPGYKEIIAIKLDYSGPKDHIVNRFAQTHTSRIVGSAGNVSPDGKRMLFNSDWGDDNIHWTEKDTYQIK